MKATYNLHDIMTNAWQIFRSARLVEPTFTFSTALKRAWQSAKAAIINATATYTMTSGRNTIVLNLKTGLITGDTYGMRSIIKSDLHAEWMPAQKAWHNANLAELVSKCQERLARVYNLKLAEATERPTTRARSSFMIKANGVCRRCGTYCYGDCYFGR